jgi:uncharacterized Zn finger protein (UPF0148 family)
MRSGPIKLSIPNKVYKYKELSNKRCPSCGHILKRIHTDLVCTKCGRNFFNVYMEESKNERLYKIS